MKACSILGQRGTAALEFGITAPLLFALLLGGIEYSRLLWTKQALQLAGDQTARCVAIGGAACATPSSYAVSTAVSYGALGLVTSGVTVDNQPPTVTLATACNPPSGNMSVRVTLSLTFSSPISALLPGLSKAVSTTSCYPLTGN